PGALGADGGHGAGGAGDPRDREQPAAGGPGAGDHQRADRRAGGAVDDLVRDLRAALTACGFALAKPQAAFPFFPIQSPPRPLYAGRRPPHEGHRMAAAPLTDLLHHLDALTGDPTSDSQLLERFASTRDPGAFAALVRRHG